jgi:O-antigen/teichoic acid export membrane protein
MESFVSTNALHRVRRSILFAAVERYGNVLLFMGSTVLLSRLLSPEEFGVYFTINAMASLVFGWSHEFGGANYLIQKDPLTLSDIRTAFTITLCTYSLVAVLIAGLSGFLASMYSQEGIQAGIAVVAAGYLFAPFTVTVSALLRRELAFHVSARSTLIASFISITSSVCLTFAGLSFMGPVFGSLIGQGVLALLFFLGPRPRGIFVPSLKGYRDVLGFGVYSSSTVIINVLYDTLPQLILGRLLDFTAVGLYGRAVSLRQLFDKLVLGAISPVIMPAISSQVRAGLGLRPLYLKAIELLTAVQWPFATFIALMAEPIVRIWLGPSWTEVVPLVRILSLASMCMFAACLTYPVLVSLGRVRDTLISSLISVPPSLLVIYTASHFGLRIVAASEFITLPFQVAVALYFIKRQLGFGFGEVVSAMLKSGAVTGCSVAALMVGIAMNDFSLTMPTVAFCGISILGVMGWLVGLIITRHPLLSQILAAIEGASVGTAVLRGRCNSFARQRDIN